MSLRKEASKVRKILKSKCPTLSVRMGKGTARSWIDVVGSLKFGGFTKKELKCLKSLGIGIGGIISPEEKRRLLRIREHSKK